MSVQAKNLEQFQKAKELLAAFSGKQLSRSEHNKRTIELAELLLSTAIATQNGKEFLQEKELSRMMRDPDGKAFTIAMMDQAFRSNKPLQVADQLSYLLKKFGIPSYLPLKKRFQLFLFQLFGNRMYQRAIPAIIKLLRDETASLILPAETAALKEYIRKRENDGYKLNINYLGEAILSEQDADRRLKVYQELLSMEGVNFLSIKISSIYSQINLAGADKTIESMSERVRALFRATRSSTTPSKQEKFITFDMEEYEDLHLTKNLFMKVLSEPEFLDYSAGIALQAYLPDSYHIQQDITKWAQERVEQGGTPVKIRLVKGANMMMEQVKASLKNRPQAPYKHKQETDANFKRMLHYGIRKNHAKYVHLGIATHNLFDISSALLLRSENHVEDYVTFEMLEGMANHISRTIQEVSGELLMYCPITHEETFHHALAYLTRRLDENTEEENFLAHGFDLRPGTPEWEEEKEKFIRSRESMDETSDIPRRIHSYSLESRHHEMSLDFKNEPNTDLSLLSQQVFFQSIKPLTANDIDYDIPLVINGREIRQAKKEGISYDPSNPQKPLYYYSMADWDQLDQALATAESEESAWSEGDVNQRCKIIHKFSELLRKERKELIRILIADCGKVSGEADAEISEAIDFSEYYLRQMKQLTECSDISLDSKGTVLVASPWNFPLAIPAGGIIAALITGNCVLFKPAPETVLSAWHLVNIFWKAGIPKKVLQFINCLEDPYGSKLIADQRITSVILTGATVTAKRFLKIHPNINLHAETGGKNSIIVTTSADQELAIRDIVQSAFGYSGQKCSAASLLICVGDLYKNESFLNHLKETASSLQVGPAWNSTSRVVPLIHKAQGPLKQALSELEDQETWLLEPNQDSENPNLWSPGIKMGVAPGSFSHQIEFFGPLLSIMHAKDLEHAIELANSTPYGLTAGLHTLDEREQRFWLERIEAGNCYINREITGAVVCRQPFGGIKSSSFGQGFKAGGPNYLMQFLTIYQSTPPSVESKNHPKVEPLTAILEESTSSQLNRGIWAASICSYEHWRSHFSDKHDPMLLVGQDNYLRYLPHKDFCFRVSEFDTPLDILRVAAAAITCSVSIEISYPPESLEDKTTSQVFKKLSMFVICHLDTEEQFISKIRSGLVRRVRMLSEPAEPLRIMSNYAQCHIDVSPVMVNGRYELPHYFQEQSISINYHRYGNQGIRKDEKRHSVA